MNYLLNLKMVIITSIVYIKIQMSILKHFSHQYLNCSYFSFLFLVYGSKPGLVIPAYSDYFVLLNPGPEFPFAPGAFDILGVVIQLFCGLILVVLFLLLSLCLLHRYTKQVAQAQGVEMMTLRNSFR